MSSAEQSPFILRKGGIGIREGHLMVIDAKEGVGKSQVAEMKVIKERPAFEVKANIRLDLTGENDGL